MVERRFHIFMRRTNPVEPSEPLEPVEPSNPNPPTFLYSFFEIHSKILYNKTLEYNQAQKTNFCEAKKEGYHVSH